MHKCSVTLITYHIYLRHVCICERLQVIIPKPDQRHWCGRNIFHARKRSEVDKKIAIFRRALHVKEKEKKSTKNEGVILYTGWCDHK